LKAPACAWAPIQVELEGHAGRSSAATLLASIRVIRNGSLDLVPRSVR